jgi:hypothetical protein
MQDLIGGVRDMQTLAQSLKDSRSINDLGTVLKRAENRKKALFRKFEKQYLKRPDFQNKAQLLFATAVEQP